METRKNTKIDSKIVLLDTRVDADEEMFEAFEDYCDVNGYKVRGKGCDMEGLFLGGKVTFSQWLADDIQETTDEFWGNLKRVKDSSYIDYYVVNGSLGLWNGNFGGICETFNNLYDAMMKCATDAYDMRVTCDGNVIAVTTFHHDGTNSFEIRRLTWTDCDKIEWWDNDKDGNVFSFIKKNAQPITYEMLGETI